MKFTDILENYNSMATLGIKGHPTRGGEVIQLLEMLGVNRLGYKDTFVGFYYYIECGAICSSDEYPTYSTIFTLEEFEEKFPYKVGDKVIVWIDGYRSICNVQNMEWDSIANEIKYKIQDYWYSTINLQPYKEEIMEKINVAELLCNCPSGMALDCTMYEDVCFDYVDELNIIHCYIQHEAHKTSITFNQHGTPNSDIKSKCVIFPKGKTTWEGFRPPFKDGDIISGCYFDAICIFKDEGNIKGTIDYYCGISGSDELLIKDVKKQDEHFGYIDEYKLATEEEKAMLFDAIKANGYKWNEETKNLDKIKPKFKVNDQVKHIYDKDNRVITIIGMKEEYYDIIYFNNRKDDFQCEKVLFADQDKYELIPNKFDITSSKKATQHKFKVGDRIKHRCGEIVYRIVQITEGSYVLDNLYSIPISVEYMYDLVPNKFDITTLKPFESKVLVRDTNTDKWRGAFYSHYKSKKFYIIGGSYYYQCIPYEGNEYLLDTTNDCDNYYKNW